MSEPPPQPPNPNSYPVFPWMWNSPIPRPPDVSKGEDDESWEVRAFAEDTSSVTGTTWPPRSYTCTFCRREFRSAQALGGHMNVHRRDRARLQLAPPPNPAGQVLISPHSCNYNSNPLQLEFFENRAGFCLVCQQLANPCSGVLGCAEPPLPDVEFDVENSGEEDDKKEDEVREVELDLELRLGN